MLVNHLSNTKILPAKLTIQKSHIAFVGQRNQDTFETKTAKNIKQIKDKHGDLKTIIEYDKDNSISRKGKMIENNYGIQKLLVEYPKSKKHKKELFVIDSNQKLAYKIQKEDCDKNPKKVHLSHYSLKYSGKKITGFPKDKSENLKCSFIVDKNTHKIDEYNLFNGKISLMQIKISRDDKNRMIKNTITSNNDISTTDIKYSKDKTQYHFSNKFFDELITTPKASEDEQHTVTLRKKLYGNVLKTEFNYFKNKQLDYTEYDSNENIVLKVIGDPETKDVISYKEYDQNNLVKDEYIRKNFFEFEHKEYKDGILVKKSEEEYSPYDFDKDITVPNEKNLLDGIVQSYKVNEIFPIKYS